jgi:hypothetical protein
LTPHATLSFALRDAHVGATTVHIGALSSR